MWERTDGSSHDSWECRNDCIVTVGAKPGVGTNWMRQGQMGEREVREDENMSCRHVSSTKWGFKWGVSEWNRSKKDSLCIPAVILVCSPDLRCSYYKTLWLSEERNYEKKDRDFNYQLERWNQSTHMQAHIHTHTTLNNIATEGDWLAFPGCAFALLC